MHISSYKMPYVAAPKDTTTGSPIIVKAITLEELVNVNGWRVDVGEFEKVASQYRDGRQLRLNHSKDVQEIIGKSFNSKVLNGSEVEGYMGAPIEGLNKDSKYVVTEFEADPQDLQVRTNILRRYVDTGSIGLDAKATCDECGEPLIERGEELEKTCHHLDAAVKLTEVEVKEYSYVSEPAYPHSYVLPSFTGAISKLPKPKMRVEESSLSQSDVKTVSEMSAVIPKVEVAAAKKATAEGDGEDDSDSESIPKKYADAIMAAYKKGMSDGADYGKKFRADDSADSDSDSDTKKKADAAAETKPTSVAASEKKTDQITRVATEVPPATTERDDFMNRILYPTSIGLDPAMKELFRAASNVPTTPSEIRSKFKGRFD